MDMNEQIQRIFNEIKKSMIQTNNPNKLLDHACEKVICLINQTNVNWMNDLMDQMEVYEMDENLLGKE